MIVDDSESIREVLRQSLDKSGYELCEGVDGQEALEKLQNQKVDLLITDLRMPRMDGITLIKKVRELPEHKFLPIIFLTTETQHTKKMQAREAGASGWIVKPFEEHKLLSAIRKVMR